MGDFTGVVGHKVNACKMMIYKILDNTLKIVYILNGERDPYEKEGYLL